MKTLFKALAGALLALAALCAQAQTSLSVEQPTSPGSVGWFGVTPDAQTGAYLNTLVASKHFSARKQGEWNERHHGIALGYALNRTWRGELGQYDNSFGDPSNYVAACYTPWGNDTWRAGACAIAADGYDKQDPSKWKLGGGLTLRYQPGAWYAGLLWGPKAPSTKPHQDNSAVLALTVGAKFWGPQ